MRRILPLILLTLLSCHALAQDSTMLRKHPPKQSILERMFVGGNVGLQFGEVTYAEFSPIVGYKFNDKIAAGIGGIYQYYHFHNPYYDLETNVYGGRVFGRYNFTDYLFGHLEYEYLNLEAFDFKRRRVDVGSLLAGGGYVQRISDHSGIVAMVLYNFTESTYTPYASPIIFRIGFMAGI